MTPEDNHPTPAQKSSVRAHTTRSFGARLKHSAFFRTRRRTVITLLLGVPLVLCSSFWLLGFVAFADAASLVELKGLVQTQHEDETQ